MIDEQERADIRDQAAKALGQSLPGEELCRLVTSEGGYDRALWSLAAELGWLSMSVPESAGGLGLGMEYRCVLAQELGRHLAAIPFTVTTAAWSAVAQAGSPEQRDRLADWCAASRIVSVAVLEAGDSGIPARPRTRFMGGRINGQKIGVLAGRFAETALVHATDDAGHAAIVVADLSAAGVVRTSTDMIDNSRGYADIDFNDVPGQLLGGEAVLRLLLRELAVLTAFEQAGGAGACLDVTRDFVLERRAFGRSIGAFQAVKHSLADMYVQAELAKGAAGAAIRRFDQGGLRFAAGARLAASRAYDHCAQEAIQLHGAIGATWDSPLHLHYRRARCLALEWGGQVAWRELMLREVLDEHGI